MFSPELHAVSSAEWYASFSTSQLHSYADTGPGPLKGEERWERGRGRKREREGEKGREKREEEREGGEREGEREGGEGREKGIKGLGLCSRGGMKVL